MSDIDPVEIARLAYIDITMEPGATSESIVRHIVATLEAAGLRIVGPVPTKGINTALNGLLYVNPGADKIEGSDQIFAAMLAAAPTYGSKPEGGEK